MAECQKRKIIIVGFWEKRKFAHDFKVALFTELPTMIKINSRIIEKIGSVQDCSREYSMSI